MVIEKRSLIIIGDNKLLAEVRYIHDIFHTIKVLRLDHKIILQRTSSKGRREIHFYELLLIDCPETLNKYFKALAQSPNLFFNESTNLIS